jgi:hypothetical protein
MLIILKVLKNVSDPDPGFLMHSDQIQAFDDQIQHDELDYYRYRKRKKTFKIEKKSSVWLRLFLQKSVRYSSHRIHP